MEVICIEDAAFHALIEKVVARLKEKNEVNANPWISPKDAMEMLNIKSKTTLQRLRDEGHIEFSQNGKMILYKVDSLNQYLEKHAKGTESLPQVYRSVLF